MTSRMMDSRVGARAGMLLGALVLGCLPLPGINACSTEDMDGDGITTSAGDCNDLDASAYPGAPEICDGEDNNCNGAVDDGISCAGIIVTVAGSGFAGYDGDGQSARNAELALPYGVGLANGRLLVADTSNHVARGLTGSIIDTVAGTGTQGFAGDGGLATEAWLSSPFDLAGGGKGDYYLADTGNHRIRRVTSDGLIFTFAGTGTPAWSGDGGLATSAALMSPKGVFWANDTLYIADSGNNRIRRVGGDGVITTLAGTGSAGYGGDGGQATAAKLNAPAKLTVDANKTVYVADSGNHRLRKITSSGVITTVAGTGTAGYSGDGGLATAATLNRPEGVTVDTSGNLFVSDGLNHRVRRISSSGVISTVAGSGVSGYSGDEGPATASRLNFPEGLALDSAGNLYVADSGNSVIRKVYRNW